MGLINIIVTYNAEDFFKTQMKKKMKPLPFSLQKK